MYLLRSSDLLRRFYPAGRCSAPGSSLETV